MEKGDSLWDRCLPTIRQLANYETLGGSQGAAGHRMGTLTLACSAAVFRALAAKNRLQDMTRTEVGLYGTRGIGRSCPQEYREAVEQSRAQRMQAILLLNSPPPPFQPKAPTGSTSPARACNPFRSVGPPLRRLLMGCRGGPERQQACESLQSELTDKTRINYTRCL